MQTFVWVMLTILGIESLVKVICLARGYMPPRNKVATVIDVVLGVAFIVWGAILLHGA